PVLGLKAGALDEMDFWAGTVGLALFGFLETMMFVWLFGPRKAWEELHLGAEVRLPKVFYYILTYVTPILLLVVFIAWAWQDGWAMLTMKGADAASIPWRWAARMLIFVTAGLSFWLVSKAWKRREARA
ncbi:MAG: sodium:calcium symporter, partial [Phycisphaerae bacterium]|nr:sodium:calcium symporter [Phycisphaerae bacterium]